MARRREAPTCRAGVGEEAEEKQILCGMQTFYRSAGDESDDETHQDLQARCQ